MDFSENIQEHIYLPISPRHFGGEGGLGRKGKGHTEKKQNTFHLFPQVILQPE